MAPMGGAGPAAGSTRRDPRGPGRDRRDGNGGHGPGGGRDDLAVALAVPWQLHTANPLALPRQFASCLAITHPELTLALAIAVTVPQFPLALAAPEFPLALAVTVPQFPLPFAVAAPEFPLTLSAPEFPLPLTVALPGFPPPLTVALAWWFGRAVYGSSQCGREHAGQRPAHEPAHAVDPGAAERTTSAARGLGEQPVPLHPALAAAGRRRAGRPAVPHHPPVAVSGARIRWPAEWPVLRNPPPAGHDRGRPYSTRHVRRR